NADERRGMLEGLGAAYARGYPVDWKRVAPADARFVELPTYPWQRERYWVELDPDARRLAAPTPEDDRTTSPSPVAPEPPRWQGLSVAEAGAALRALVREVVAGVLGFTDPDALDADRGFAEQGLDSLMAVRIRTRLEAKLGVGL